MNQNIIKYLKDYSYDTWDINRLLVSTFLVINNIRDIQNKFIKKYIIVSSDLEESQHLKEFIELLSKTPFGIEELEEYFEFVISPVDKEINGAVYTPEYIRKYIVGNTIQKHIQNDNDISNLKFGDIACGCGGFFKTVTELLKSKTNKSYFEIYKENIYGLDIEKYSIIRTKILLSLIAILNGEDCPVFVFNLYKGNALNFDWSSVEDIKLNNGFDIIVGNPPYVGVIKMDNETRELMKLWSVSSTGKPDLYIPFFQIGMENLNDSGVLGFITVNTFYKSLNGRGVRSYFSKNQFNFTLIDFGNEQLFKNRSTYTCICLLSKSKNESVKYLKTPIDKLGAIKSNDFIEIAYSDLDDFKGWYLNTSDIGKTISKIENTGKALGEKFVIRNGFATLRNNIYIFCPEKESDDYFYFTKKKIEYRVEKGICRNAAKPNILKSEDDLNTKMEKIIFPYEVTTGNIQSLKALTEEELIAQYPLAFEYLLSHREILAQRDKGNKTYEQWFAYGRNQALNFKGYKLLFPYLTNEPNFVLTEDVDLLFYNGFALFSDSVEELLILQKILKSKVFWFYVKNTSKPYEGNYYSTAKRYVKNFGVCELSNDEKHFLLNLKNQNEIDEFLCRKYEVEL